MYCLRLLKLYILDRLIALITEFFSISTFFQTFFKMLIKFLSLPIRILQNKETKWAEIKRFQPTKNQYAIIPTRCRDLHLKQFCLEDIAPAVLIILITHIIVAVRWMLIKILSAVINGQRSHKVIVPGGCYLDVNIIHKIDRKIKISA